MNATKHIRRGVIGALLVWVIPSAVLILTGHVGLQIVASFVYMGFVVGTSIGYRWGMKDQDALINEVYGEEWRQDAAVGYHRRRREAAPWN